MESGNSDPKFKFEKYLFYIAEMLEAMRIELPMGLNFEAVRRGVRLWRSMHVIMEGLENLDDSTIKIALATSQSTEPLEDKVKKLAPA